MAADNHPVPDTIGIEAATARIAAMECIMLHLLSEIAQHTESPHRFIATVMDGADRDITSEAARLRRDGPSDQADIAARMKDAYDAFSAQVVAAITPRGRGH